MSIPEVGGPAGPDAGGDHRRPQREIPRSSQGRRGVTAPSRSRAVSGVTHGRAARRARALMRSDRPCGRPAPCRFTVVSGGRGQRLPAWQARCNPRRTPAAAPGDRATAATELRKLSHAALGARPDSPFPIRWAGRHRRAWDLVGTERWIASCLGACRHRRVRRGRRATDLRFGGGTERPLLAVRHRAASNCSRSTAAT